MKDIFRKILILGGVFLVTLVVLLLISRPDEADEISYTLIENEKLPTVCLTVAGEEVNYLSGYVGEMDEGELLDSITPLSADRELGIRVITPGTTLTSVSYEIRRIGDRILIEGETLGSWDATETGIKAVLPIKDLIEKGVEYELIIRLTTEFHSQVSYYSRVLWDDDLKTEKMMEYVKDFHQSTFDAEEAQKYAINWEVDDSADNESLANVNIHSNFRQLTYRDLEPVEIAVPEIRILEMDRLFGSFLIKTEIAAADENGIVRNYYVEEYLCLQWSHQRYAQGATPFYLMAYERSMTQRFSPRDGDLAAKGLYLGIAGADDIHTMISPDGTQLALTDCGELWSYSSADGRFTEIFTLRGLNEGGRVNTDYDIKILDIDDAGNVDFLVYGYMSRGEHEGLTGLSVFRYSNKENTLQERRFIQSASSYELIRSEIETLATKVDRRVYFLMDDTVFILSESGEELLRMVEGATARRLQVNESETAIAWIDAQESGEADSVQLLYLDGRETQTITSAEDEYIEPHGFIDMDFVATVGKRSDISVAGYTRIRPAYALVILAKDGSESARYEYPNTYITRVTVGDGLVGLERMKKSADGFAAIEGDMLIRNAGQRGASDREYSYEKFEKRGKIAVLPVSGDVGAKPGFMQPEGISYFAGADTAESESGTDTLYYAYSEGHLSGSYDEAGYAIEAVYDEMGWVADESGRRVWHRTARDPEKTVLSMPPAGETDGDGTPMAKALDAIFRLEGVSVDAEELLEMGLSVGEAIEKETGADLLRLESCSVKALYPFLAEGSPVLSLGEAGEPLIIIGYEDVNFVIYDPSEDSSYKIGFEAAEQQFEESGRQFITYLRADR